MVGREMRPYLCCLFQSLDGFVLLLELRLEEVDALTGAQGAADGRGDPATSRDEAGGGGLQGKRKEKL